MRVLCTGDIHIGRRASRLPDPLPSHLHADQFSCAAAWGTVVDVAIQERADIVAISGDVVDRQNRYFEAVGPFERGLRRLADADIEVVAVTGNHDFDVLPLLARGSAAQHIRLLGAGGMWERYTVQRSGAPVLHIDGWSFPTEHVLSNPLSTYPTHSNDGVPVLGVVHADLDQGASRYAPVALSQLRERQVVAWLLGHIHHPRLIHESGQPLVLYPGSPLAMDPGEMGAHGPWLLEVVPGQPVACRQVPTSRVYYDSLTVDVDGITDPDELRMQVTSSIQERLVEITRDCEALACMSFRLTLTGRTPLHSSVARHLKELIPDFQPQMRTATGYIERLTDETRPVLSLDDLARRNDPPGELARVLLALESEVVPQSCRTLLDDTLTRLNDLRRQRVYGPIINDDPLDLSTARQHLLREGFRLLDTLVAQRETASL